MNLSKEKQFTVLIVQGKVKRESIAAMFINGVMVSGGRDIEPRSLV